MPRGTVEVREDGRHGGVVVDERGWVVLGFPSLVVCCKLFCSASVV